jgi:hypothetical protein
MLSVNVQAPRTYTLRDALTLQQAAVSSAMMHASAPFLQILDTLRSLDHFIPESSRNPYFQCVCNVQRGQGLHTKPTVKIQDLNFCEGQMDINLMMQERKSNMLASCQYAVDLFCI